MSYKPPKVPDDPLQSLLVDERDLVQESLDLVHLSLMLRLYNKTMLVMTCTDTGETCETQERDM